MKIKVDVYTKIMLTLIVIGLFANVIKDVDFVTKVQANTASAPIAMPSPQAVKTDGVIDVNIVQVNGKNVGYYVMPIKSSPWLDVYVKGGSVTCN